MRAGDLLTGYPTVNLSTPVVAAARLLGERNLPGLIVVDAANRPLTILPGTQVLRMAVPALLPGRPGPGPGHRRGRPPTCSSASWPAAPSPSACRSGATELPVVDPDATLLEIAALMARTRTRSSPSSTTSNGWPARSPCTPCWTGCSAR